jgi:sugar-specific transcriptional regulator TrmB
MSLERVFKILASLGFTKTEAEVYVYLAKRGPQKGRDLTSALKMTKQQLYTALKGLQKKGAVTSSSDRSALYFALAFEDLLNLYVKLNIDQAQTIKETKEELLASWQNITKRSSK